MKQKITGFITLIIGLSTLLGIPNLAFAAGVSLSGGGTKYPGDEFYITVTASGTTFNAFEGTISSSGQARIVSCSASKALWVNEPSGSGSFSGALTSTTTSFKIATLKVRAVAEGTGTISVSGVQLANNGSIVGTGTDSLSFTVIRRPTPPGTVTVTSSTHPDSNTAYEATTVTLAWEKGSASGFAYSYDQAAVTDPGQTITNDATTATYESLAVGEYYFHIRAKNADGWGPATHFKFTIKEPDPRINDTMGKPHDIVISKLSEYTNTIIDGTFSGWSISGITEPNYVANVILDPLPTLPEGKVLSVTADAEGKFTYVFDYPIKAAIYKVTVQGQDNKTLTPISDAITLEISQKNGGQLNILTSGDEREPIIPAKKWWEKINYMILSLGIAILFFALLGFVIYLLIRNKSMNKIWKNMTDRINLK